MKGLHLGVVVLKGYSGRKLGRSLWRWPFHGMVLWFYYLQHHWKGVKAHASHGSNIAPLVIIRMETPWVMDVLGKRETNQQWTLMAGNLFYWLVLLEAPWGSFVFRFFLLELSTRNFWVASLRNTHATRSPLLCSRAWLELGSLWEKKLEPG